jgi:acetylornithine deacetylase/succinyl-diaminopimelate desuccinylase-like protein
MKGPNVALAWAAAALFEAGFVPPGRARLSFTIGEESGEAEIGPLNILESGHGAELVVVAEPTDLAVCPAAVGWFFFRVDVEGKASHSASRGASIHPQPSGQPAGVNAIELMTRIMDQLRSLEEQWGLYESHPLIAPGTMGMTPVEIRGGGPQATTPDSCFATWTAVLAPHRSFAETERELEEALRAATAGNRWLEQHPPKLTAPYLQRYYEPVNLASEHPAVQAMLGSVEQVRPTARVAAMPTPSDANFFAEAGAPTLVMGPGDLLSSGVHGLDEHIAVDALAEAAKVYAIFIAEWCSRQREEHE